MVSQLTFLQWLRSFLSEDNGQGSSSRAIPALATIVSVTLAVVVSIQGKDIPAGAQVILLAAMGFGAASYVGNKLSARIPAQAPKEDAA